MELDAKRIGKTVRELRKNNHKSQERFAELIEITPRTVYNIENGFVVPQLQTIVNIAAYCNCSIEDILGISK